MLVRRLQEFTRCGEGLNVRTVQRMITRTRSPLMSVLVAAAAAGLTLAACGGDDTGGASSEVGTPGAAGHWSAAQLCSLATLGEVKAIFPDTTIAEEPGIDDPDWSACIWRNTAVDLLDPASSLLTASHDPYDGSEFSESFERITVLGADQALYTPDFGGEPVVIVTVADQRLMIDFPADTPGARELAETMASMWATLQAG